MGDEGPAGVSVTGHDVEYAGGKETGIRDQFGHADRRDRCGVRGLEHDGVAGRDSRGVLPDRHHHRVVPGSDLADDTDRLASDDRGEALHVLARRATFKHARCAGEEADLVDHRRDLLRHRHRDRLAGVLALEGHKLLSMLLEQVGDTEQRLLALRWRGVAPLDEGIGGDAVGAIDVFRPRDRCGGEDLTGRRIDQILRLATHRGHALAADHVVQHPLVAHSASFGPRTGHPGRSAASR